MKVRASFEDATSCLDKEDAFMYLTQGTPKLKFTGCEVVGASSLEDAVFVFNGTDGADNCLDASYETDAENVIANGATLVSAGTVGGNAADFAWTWAVAKGKL